MKYDGVCSKCGVVLHVGDVAVYVAVSSRLKVDTVALARRPEPGGGDVLATVPIARERDRAACSSRGIAISTA